MKEKPTSCRIVDGGPENAPQPLALPHHANNSGQTIAPRPRTITAADIDFRKSLFNNCQCGPIEKIQVCTELITSISAVMFDLDPGIYREDVLAPGTREEPLKFYKHIVSPWLGRHPALQAAEVRMSGQGLHVVIWFDNPIEFSDDAERQRWCGIVKVLQGALPIDPDMPGITATTRAIGSTNSKNLSVVTCLKKGTKVEYKVVLDLYAQLRERPFRTVMGILFGTEKCAPCPICKQLGTSLTALDRVGQCYGSCGTVKLADLYDLHFQPRKTGKKAR